VAGSKVVACEMQKSDPTQDVFSRNSKCDLLIIWMSGVREKDSKSRMTPRLLI
jgi:3'-phosphoadenosine 5'-phosphosulfate sulfotransferase (PAPS reductase)/FAD synthetase